MNTVRLLGLIVCSLFIFMSGAGSSKSVSFEIHPGETFPEDVPILKARCQPTQPKEWKYITYITIFRFANKSWHQHLVTMAGGEEPHLGFYLDKEKYDVSGSLLTNPNKAFAQVVINKPDRDDFIKDNAYLKMGCKIIGIDSKDQVVDPVSVSKLDYEGELLVNEGRTIQNHRVILFLLVFVCMYWVQT